MLPTFFSSNLTSPHSFSSSEGARETATVLFLVSFLSFSKLERSVTREGREKLLNRTHTLSHGRGREIETQIDKKITPICNVFKYTPKHIFLN